MMVINNFYQIMDVPQDWFLEASDLKTVSRCCDLPALILSFEEPSAGFHSFFFLVFFSSITTGGTTRLIVSGHSFPLILSFSLTSSGSLTSLTLLAFSGRFKSLNLFASLGRFTSLILLASSRSFLLAFLYCLIYAWRLFISQLSFLRSSSFYLNKERILCSLIITLIVYI